MGTNAVKRIAALDMLRGYALVCIMLDHMPASRARQGTLAHFALFDAAELFVILSGFLVGIVWARISTREGTAAARRRFWRRAFQVWRALVLGAVLMAGLSAALWALGMKHSAIWPGYAKILVNEPVRFVTQIATGWMQPNILDVLSMYVVLIAAVPLVMPLIMRWPWRVAVGSALIWGGSVWLNTVFPGENGRYYFLFNPFAWQALFFAGAAMGAWRARIMAALQPYHTVLDGLCAMVLTYGLLAANIPALTAPLGVVDKWNLDFVRFASVMAAAWMVAAPLSRPLEALAQTAAGHALAVIGRQGLWSFIACVLLSVWGDAWHNASGDLTAHLLVDAWCVVALYLAALIWAARPFRR